MVRDKDGNELTSMAAVLGVVALGLGLRPQREYQYAPAEKTRVAGRPKRKRHQPAHKGRRR